VSTTPLVLLHVLCRMTDVEVALVPDVVGHGAERRPAADGNFESEVDRIAGLIAARAREPVHLIGYSLGARLALGVLLRHAQLVSAATLLGVHPGLESPAQRRHRVRADERWCRLLERQGMGAFVDAWQRQPLFASQARVPKPLLEEQRRLRLAHDPHGLAGALRRLGLGRMPCYRRQLRQIVMPVRLIVGELDSKFRDIARGMLPHLPNSTGLTLPRVGHNPLLECPQRVAQLLREGTSR
jgi:2-succinyl-6-hydroxy-2,4-cyclohexadiene-1-carboxylate synthase